MDNIIPTLKYVRLTIVHKYFVLCAGLRTKTPLWQLIIHDISKFSPKEAPHYGRHFFGDRSHPEMFAAAWLHHQNHNPHHWEYWLSRTKHNKSPDEYSVLPMPMKYVREMVADWMGAGRTYEGRWPESLDTWAWLKQNRQNMRLHPITQDRIDLVLGELFNQPTESPAHD